MFDCINVSTGFVETTQETEYVINNVTEAHKWLSDQLRKYPGMRVERQRMGRGGKPDIRIRAWYDKQNIMEDTLSFVVMEGWLYSQDGIISSLQTGFIERLKASIIKHSHDEKCTEEFKRFESFIMNLQEKVRRLIFAYGV